MNECEQNPCEGRGHCVNTFGSYTCHCHSGFSQVITQNRKFCQGEREGREGGREGGKEGERERKKERERERMRERKRGRERERGMEREGVRGRVREGEREKECEREILSEDEKVERDGKGWENMCVCVCVSGVTHTCLSLCVWISVRDE